jgi:TM2 domain-containing membrane protein YozV
MSAAAVCPYCRGPIEADAEQQKVCEGCGTPHHVDCYEENGGCTVFGCSAAPAEEPELSISRTDLANATRAAAPATSRTLGLALGPAIQTPAAAPSVRVKAPPPPMPPGATVTAEAKPVVSAPRLPTFGTGSVLFGAQPVSSITLPAAPVMAQPAPAAFDLSPDANAKNRTTFIVLGVLLGFVGAHNFYAGYKKKAIGQLCITLLSAGFASPMTWIWAVIDICTIDRDSDGRHFRS